MNQAAIILDSASLYWYPILLSLSALTGFCLFCAFCSFRGISLTRAACTAAAGTVLSLLLGRLIYWNCRADSFATLSQALTAPLATGFALSGAFFGFGAAGLVQPKEVRPVMLDCISAAGCGAIALGRLGSFFSTADRGAVLTQMTELPWAYPVMNAASGEAEYRFATFLFQSITAGLLFCALLWLFFRGKRKQGSLTMLFLMVYGACQVLLDSTRYDSLYLQSNGFVSLVQILAAVALAGSLVLCSLLAVKAVGLRRWMIPSWVAMAALFGCAGYMEYFVQRHGRLALFGYAVMEHCLVAIVVLGILFWHTATKQNDNTSL